MGTGAVETGVVAFGRDELPLIRGLRVIEQTDEQAAVASLRRP
jgi:hypothetical protein